MNLFEGKTPSEKRKAIAALVLCAVALLSLSRLFFSSDGGPPQTATNTNQAVARGVTGGRGGASGRRAGRSTFPDLRSSRADVLVQMQPIVDTDIVPANVPEGRRNIFAYYVPPPTPIPTPRPEPVPTPQPPPPLILASLSPSNVYAGTGEFTLEVSGDKFTPETRVYFEGNELPTRYVSPQRLSASVPGSVIVSEGVRQISVRTRDGSLFSNMLALNVAAPPRPPYTFIGFIGDRQFADETAVLKEQGSNKLINVKRGDTIGGQWRVTSMSERSVELTHTSIRIKQTLPFVKNSGPATGGQNPNLYQRPDFSQPQPPPPPQEENNEPVPQTQPQ